MRVITITQKNENLHFCLVCLESSVDSLLTNLACNDWRVDNELNEFVKQLMQEPDTGIQHSPSQCSHAGLQLPFHVCLGYDDVLQAERKGVLLQDIH